MQKQELTELWNFSSGGIFIAPQTGIEYRVKRSESKMVEVKDEKGKKWAWPNSAKVIAVDLGRGGYFENQETEN